MKKIFSLCAALTLAVSAAYFCPRLLVDTSLDAPRGVYERAARSSVLIKTAHGQGSGVVVVRNTPAGVPVVFVWTAAHVVEGVNEVLVVQPIRSMFEKVGSIEVKARVVVRNEANDVALLQVEGSPIRLFHGARFDKNMPPPRGTKLFHCGNFFGKIFDGSISTGVVSQIGVQSAPESPWPVIDQTDLLILPGSSGGPIFRDDNQKVVGLATGIFGGHVNVYVPVRVLRATAAWAVDDTICPSLVDLSELHAKAKVEVKENLPALLILRR